MHDLRAIRDDPGAFDAALTKRDGSFAGTAERVLKLDEARRKHVRELQEAQARRNAASKEIGKAKAAGDDAKAQALLDEVAGLKSVIQEGEAKERELDMALADLLATIPNLPLDDVPVGADESANVEVRRWGAPARFDFEVRQHFEIGEALGLMDFEAAARMSGARFVMLKGALARLERAIASFMLDLHTGEFGYTEVLPPALVGEEVLFGTGQLPKFADDLFSTKHLIEFEEKTYEEMGRIYAELTDRRKKIAEVEREIDAGSIGKNPNDLHRDLIAYRYQERRLISQMHALVTEKELWLIPTAEVPLTNLVRGSILTERELPLRVTAWTPCFRAEAGAAGRDTRGMIRQHQFSKVELVSITTPEQSAAELERMTQCAEEVLKRLDLPYRVVLLSTGDMGFAARKTYDLEVWLPGQGTYREISSCSVCGDFQARRMDARYRSAANPKDIGFVHTLNGSGLAVGRTLIAILENFQQADGSVTVPPALRPYMGGLERIAA